MSRSRRDELEQAFAGYQGHALHAGTTGDWSGWADQFTEDATYVEHCYGTFGGREAIRRWVVATMGAFPGSRMPHFPVGWYVIDQRRGWVVCEVWSRMEDPGDGSVHQASNLTKLHYAGDGLWSYEEDAYNPATFLTMVRRWARAKERLGPLPDDARTWLDAMGPSPTGTANRPS